jgi:hypothetical protein
MKLNIKGLKDNTKIYKLNTIINGFSWYSLKVKANFAFLMIKIKTIIHSAEM